VDARHLYLVLKSGEILASLDGARSWTPVYRP
jgi:hypothetical protein